MRSVPMMLATAVSMALLMCGVAAASITLFEPPLFHPGSINGQSGVGGFPWKSAPLGAIPSCNPDPTNGQYDQEVVANSVAPPGEPPGFGSQSLRISNLCGNGEFFYQTYSPQEPVQVGEVRVNKVFMAQFSFMPNTPAYQPGLFLSVSPDSHEGSRMSWVGLEDTPAGIQVTAADTPEVDGKFVYYDLALLKDRTVPHTVRFWMKVNPGRDNDLVRIEIDNRDVGQCFTTWENYYRTAPEQAPPPNANTPADINSLQFRSSVQGPPELAQSGGYLFDNVSMTPSDGPGPPGARAGRQTLTRRHKRGSHGRATSSRTGSASETEGTRRRGGYGRATGCRARSGSCGPSRACIGLAVVGCAARSVCCGPVSARRSAPPSGCARTSRLTPSRTAASVDIPTGSAPSSSQPDSAVIPKPRRRRVAARDAAVFGVLGAGAESCSAALNHRAHAAC